MVLFTANYVSLLQFITQMKKINKKLICIQKKKKKKFPLKKSLKKIARRNVLEVNDSIFIP